MGKRRGDRKGVVKKVWWPERFLAKGQRVGKLWGREGRGGFVLADDDGFGVGEGLVEGAVVVDDFEVWVGHCEGEGGRCTVRSMATAGESYRIVELLPSAQIANELPLKEA